MSTKTVTVLTCDLHGDDTRSIETVPFAVDGTEYELDLCRKHAREVRSTVKPYTEAARLMKRARNGRRRPYKSMTVEPNVPTVRAWAQSNGYEVNSRGRIPAFVMDAYAAAY
ncbi:MAG: Lsr2 family protein [Actinobacteria bacterium]|nr:Lsr2 family protein [Actinomycetota bacterium]